MREFIKLIEGNLDAEVYSPSGIGTIGERAPESRSVEMEWVVESYRKTDNQVLLLKNVSDRNTAWETAKSLKRGADSNIGIRIVEITTTTVVTSKSRSL